MPHVFYPAMVDRQGDLLTVSVPDLDVSRSIDTTESAYDEAFQAAAAAVEALRKRSAPIPPPSPLAKWTKRVPARLCLFQVPVGLHREYVRVGINMEPRLLRQVDEVALSRGMTRTAALSTAAASWIKAELAA